ncbi:MAG TPA: hypothetical protein VLE74_02625, partial [Candidatus Saccharimonadales bacterium]|nr:hypothetical protein [Candidatus Saccharimonadales bacterium]
TQPELSVLQRLGGLAATGVAGYAMHRGLHSEALGAPIEHLPVSEVAEITVIGATLALTGLREQVTGARIRLAETQRTRADKAEKRETRRAKEGEASFTRIMEGKPVPYDTDMSRDMVEPDLSDKVRRGIQRVRHPLRRRQIHDAYTATSSRLHNWDVKRMNNQRDKKRLLEMEADAQHKWYGRARVYDHAQKVRPENATNDLGTDLGWRRFFQTPRNRQEVRGYKKAVGIRGHALHEAEAIEHETKKVRVTKPQRAAKYHAKRKTSAEERITRLQEHQTAIRNREDLASRVYDRSKERSKIAAKATGRVAWRGTKATGRRVGRNVAGIWAVPSALREGKNGIAVNNGRIQARINKVAQGLGRKRAARKSSP